MAVRPTVLSVKHELIPQSLRTVNRWLVWKLVEKGPGKKWAKVPCDLKGRPTDQTSSKSWLLYQDALSAYGLGSFDGIGFVFDGSDGIHGIDIDDCVDGLGGLNDAARELLERTEGYAETSPSGTGIKLFTRSNIVASAVKKPVEIYRDGRYFTVTGHALNGHADLPDSIQDVGWFVDKHIGVGVGVGVGVGAGSHKDFDALALYKPPLNDWDLDRVESELLQYIKADSVETYEGWVKVGMILHHQGSGDGAWMELWDKISRDTASYDRVELIAKWGSFSKQRTKGSGALTLASLIKEVGEAKTEENRVAIDSYKDKILAVTNTDELKEKVCVDIQADRGIDRFNRDVLAQIVKTRFKALGVSVGIAEVKRLLKPKSDGHSPGWLEDWVYVTHEDKFFNAITKRKVSERGFNAMYNREVGGMDSDTKASAMAMDLWCVDTPDKIIYLPSAGEFFDLNGMPCVNGYDPGSPPDIVAVYTKADLAAIEIVKAHLELILTEPEGVGVMLAWIAHNVQFPGKKIRWAPLIKGIEGDGKTVIGKLLSSVMGMVNVGNVSIAVLSTAFTSWADGRCVNILEEIRMVGHNRYDILNMIKPYITNDAITVHPKGVNEYVAPNTVNYIAFTNHQDALPLEETDRRWWVQFTPFTGQEQLKAAAGPEYFVRLHGAIEGHSGALRKWLLEYQIPDSFEPNGQAPKSSAKDSMISLNTSNTEDLIKELIERGSPGVCSNVISTSHLGKAMSFEEGFDDDEIPKTSALTKILMKLGFTKMKKPIKWQGNTARIWILGVKFGKLSETECNEKIREILDQTLMDPLLD